MKTNAERDHAIDKLREELQPGTIIYTVLRHTSRSRTAQWIEFYHINGNQLSRITWDVTQVTEGEYCRKRDAFRATSCGMDAGFSATYTLGQVLHGNGRAFSHQRL
jgi:ribosomal protein S12 methylthiotransferase accessory factor YcaO